MQRVHVNFKGSAFGLFLVQLVYGFLTVITFGILLPLYVVKMHQWYLQGLDITIETVKEAKHEK